MSRYPELHAAVLRFSPSRYSGEQLNVGLLTYDPDSRKFWFRGARVLQRMSCAFGSGSVASLKGALRAIERVKERLNSDGHLIETLSVPESIQEFFHLVLPDSNGALFFDTPFMTFKSNFEEDSKALYETLVGQFESNDFDHFRHDDDYVWKSVEDVIRSRHKGISFDKRRYGTGEDQVTFKHALIDSSGSNMMMALDPVSLDYKRQDSIERRCDGIIGRDVRLQYIGDFKVCTVVYGLPTLESLIGEARVFQSKIEKCCKKTRVISIDQAAHEFDKLVRS